VPQSRRSRGARLLCDSPPGLPRSMRSRTTAVRAARQVSNLLRSIEIVVAPAPARLLTRSRLTAACQEDDVRRSTPHGAAAAPRLVGLPTVSRSAAARLASTPGPTRTAVSTPSANVTSAAWILACVFPCSCPKGASP
jgi:hypothetical protein